MRPTHLIALLAATVLVLAAVPAAANAYESDYDADLKAMRVATHFYPRYTWVANCDQQGRRWYWCMMSGRRGSCFMQGNATVRYRGTGRYHRFRVRLRAMNRSCF